MKKIALKFGSTARIKTCGSHAPETFGSLDFSGSPMGANPPTC